MKEEMFSNDESIEEINLWDFSEDTQEVLKDIFRKTGFDKKIDIDAAFIKREEPESFELFELRDVLPEDTAPKNDFFKSAPFIKVKPSEKSEVNNLALDGKVKFSDKIEYIHLSKLAELDDSINFFPLPDNEEFLDLMESIEKYGVLTPLLVIHDKESDQYIVLCGKSRRTVLIALFNGNSKITKQFIKHCKYKP